MSKITIIDVLENKRKALIIKDKNLATKNPNTCVVYEKMDKLILCLGNISGKLLFVQIDKEFLNDSNNKEICEADKKFIMKNELNVDKNILKVIYL